MKCKICGAKLKKEGDICKNCYQDILREEALENDVNEMMTIERKYIPEYEIKTLTYLIVIFTLVVISIMTTQSILNVLIVAIIFIAVIAGILAVRKKLAIGTKCTFYETKLKYNFDFLFIHTEKIIKYEDINDISYYQTRRQKKYDFVDLCVYVKFTGLFGGFCLKNMPNAEKDLLKIKEIVFKKEEQEEE